MVATNQQRICIGPEVPQDSKNPVTMLLPHPSSGFPSRYVIQEGQLYEMQLVDSEGLRSWFIRDTVQSDGSLYIITPIDPLFMCIPILDIVRQRTSESEGLFLGLQDIFESDQYTSLRNLVELDKLDQHLALVCDVRESDSGGGGGSGKRKTFRLDNHRTLTWLKRKVQVLADKFSSIPVLVDSIDYTESLHEICQTEAITQSALRLVSAYLSESWAKQLAAEYQFPELEKLESRIQLPTLLDFGKRSATDMDEDSKPKEIKKPKMSAGQRKLAKASTTGMKPLSSFFAKKSA
ncbi:Ribonuclease H2 subunit B [Modicella reniformis]|uniref:Ribonuclease H2 subunit B n=1 Tax=Modicella reniformis TaxID=1440133 RepID=A0A9P6MJ06_9FUNG|nr:Ribonuclease H2 subunit B [Modicella reniformis]